MLESSNSKTPQEIKGESDRIKTSFAVIQDETQSMINKGWCDEQATPRIENVQAHLKNIREYVASLEYMLGIS